jgi:hypothetical protein
MGLGQRVIGVIVSPAATYAAVAAHPRVLGVLAAVAITTALVAFAFLSTEVGQNAMLDQQLRVLESLGLNLPDQAYEQMEARLSQGRYYALANILVFTPVACGVVAGLMQLIFNVALGSDASFKQAYAVAAHSQVLIALQQLFVTPLNYARETMSSGTNLGIFLPMLDETGFAARLLGAIDLVWIWWIVNLAIGIGVLYKRSTAPIAWSLLGVYFVIGLIVATVTSLLSGA